MSRNWLWVRRHYLPLLPTGGRRLALGEGSLWWIILNCTSPLSDVYTPPRAEFIEYLTALLNIPHPPALLPRPPAQRRTLG